jgi:small subunit ribosomal protein S9
VLKLSKKKDLIQTYGKRKKAVARATAKAGNGTISDKRQVSGFLRAKGAQDDDIQPILLAGKNNLDIDVTATGGGVFGQAAAIRQCIAKALAESDESLRPSFMEYDRNMLVSDSRRTEPHKPGTSRRGPRRHKQRSKR